jgi:hypothetical protein
MSGSFAPTRDEIISRDPRGKVLSLVPQIARCHTVDVGQAPVSACAEVQTGHQVEQATVSEVCDRNRQGLFIKSVDIATDDSVQ